MAESLSRTLARFVVSLSYESLPPPVVDKIKASLLHALIISIVGADTSHGAASIRLVKEEEGKPDGATILVDGGRATRAGAAAETCQQQEQFDRRQHLFGQLLGAAHVRLGQFRKRRAPLR